MRRLLFGVVKLGLSAAILAYLIWEATSAGQHADVFSNLLQQPKEWGILALAFLTFLASIELMIVRWWYLTRALDVPSSLDEVIRIGHWGLFFNLAPLGVVSGDVVKAILLARKHPGHRPRIVASVLVDRVIGVYLLFVFVSVTMLVTDFANRPSVEIKLIRDATYAVTALVTVGIAVVMSPGITGGLGLRTLASIPRVGPPLESLIQAVRLYRHRLRAVGITAALTIVVHALSSVSCYLISRGLGGDVLPLSDQFVVVPIGIAASILPLPLGPFEFVLEFLYTELSPVVPPSRGHGLIVALVYRMLAILVAAGGVLCFFGERRQVAEASREAGGP